MGRLPLVYLLVCLAACGDNHHDAQDRDGGVDDDAPVVPGDGPVVPDDGQTATDDAPVDAMPIVYPMGSLVGVQAQGRVGVLLDDFPVASRDRLADDFAAAPQSFWITRAKAQIQLSYLRLVYRELYYPANSGKDSLPLTEPDLWNITMSSAGAQRRTIDGHDLITWDYTFQTVILSDEGSPGITEPALGTIGGQFTESFVFPVDPTLIYQRTGLACMDEDEFPEHSVDEENAWEFYDDACKAENPNNLSCHMTLPLPTVSCVRAVRDSIGRATVNLVFTRLPWDEAMANSVRRGPVTQQNAPDLAVVDHGYLGLENNHVIYRYFDPSDCALIEHCVAAPGWRRLLTFDSYDHNQGAQPIHIGEVDYFIAGLGSELIMHNAYEYSACHNHYHFEYYGTFSYGTSTDLLHKNGFCLESTGRISNNELSPLHQPYDCELQGVAPGWGDLYAAGLPCNWVDVTPVDTSSGAVTQQLQFASNPDGFICEGTLQKDANGDQIWEPTQFTTESGDPVDRPACDEAPGTEANDVKSVPVTLPQKGGMLTSACTDDQQLGPRRNCGFTAQSTLLACTAGQPVTLSCSGGSTSQPQVVRLCETSRALGAGTDCVYRDALANTVLEGIPTMITTTCPAARDATEIGGQLAVYSAPVYAPDGASAVTCTVVP
jgi:hypothetical protein